MSAPEVSILIVNYNTQELLAACLESIRATVGGWPVEIIVVDNNSQDGSSAMVSQRFKEVRLLSNTSNLGFASANNQAIAASCGTYLLLLNPDTRVMPGAIQTMYEFMETHPEAGIVGCSIRDRVGHLQPSAGRFPTLGRVFLQSVFLDKIFSYLPGLQQSTLNIFRLRHCMPVDWVTGACLMVRRRVIEQVGVLDGNYFLYFEEVDFCYRAKKAGWQVYFVPEAGIIHYLAQSTSRNLRKTILESYKSSYYYFHKHYPPRATILLRWVMASGIILRSAIWQVIRLVGTVRLRKEAQERLWAYLHAFWRKFSLRIALDMTAALRSKAGVGHYTLSLAHGLEKLKSPTQYSFVKYRHYTVGKNRFQKLLNFLKHLIWENLFLPLWLWSAHVDLLHSPAYELPLFVGCRSVVTIHDMAFWLYPQKFTTFYRSVLKQIVPWAARRATMIITDSKQSKRDIVELLRVNPERVAVVYLGVDPVFRPRKKDDPRIADVRMKYRLGPEPYILYVGTLEPRKNIGTLIRAYSRFIHEHGPRYQLVIAGMRGWLYEYIFRVVRELQLTEMVVFAGYVADEDLPFLYNGAELFVYLSLYEGFGLPVLEAMASGVPVVTSNTSSLPELVKDSGVMVDPQDIDAISSAMAQLLYAQDLRNHLIEKGLARAADFPWEKTVDETVRIYDEVLQRP